MAVRTLSVDQGLKGTRTTPQDNRRLPTRWRYTIVQRLTAGPDVIGSPAHHCRCLELPYLAAETGTNPTQGIERDNQIHAPFDRGRPSCKHACPPPEDRQAAAEGAIQPLDERGVRRCAYGRRTYRRTLNVFP